MENSNFGQVFGQKSGSTLQTVLFQQENALSTKHQATLSNDTTTNQVPPMTFYQQMPPLSSMNLLYHDSSVS